MLNKSGVLLGMACALAVAGAAQATTLTPIATKSGDTSWQNIGAVSYTFADNNHDARLDVGDTVTFSLTMEKSNWGTHRFDAMRVWLDDATGNNLQKKDFTWFYYQDETLPWFEKRTYDQIKNDGNYSYKGWSHSRVEVFQFSYKFEKAGTYDLLASVMCSRDLSGLDVTDGKGVNDSPTGADWTAWTKNIHSTTTGWMQGQDKSYRLTVAAVPEPGTYAMMIAGLGMLGAIARRRKQG
jgi:hypothetical protein